MARTVCTLLMLLTLAAGTARAQARDSAEALPPSAGALRKSPLLDVAGAQYAGSIGLYALGIGRVSGNRKWLGMFFVGRVPEGKGGPFTVLAAKFEYRPLRVPLAPAWHWNAINPVAFVSYHIGPNYWLKQPSNQYPKDYYWHSTALRLHPGLSTELELDTRRRNPRAAIDKVSAYLEANTNDLYLISYFGNRPALKLGDIWYLGAGVRVYL